MLDNTLNQKKRDQLERQLAEHRTHEQRSLFLLKMGFILTFLLYLGFNFHLYLGDPSTWVHYFQNWQAVSGFMFYSVIVILMALFLAWVKHHAYLHFGLYGSIALIVTTVIGFALFAEFFSSSANQDAKSNLLLENNAAYKQTLINPISAIQAAPLINDSSLNNAISEASQRLARCQENLRMGTEKHCKGDTAKLQALKQQQADLNQLAATTAKAQAQAQAQAAAATLQLNHARQDKLKSDSYNPVIVMLARLMGTLSSSDYTQHIKSAVVIIMLIVAVAFEILHHFLSGSKERASQAVMDLELDLARLYGTEPPLAASQPPFKDSSFKDSGIGFTAPLTAQAPRFKYQRDTPVPPVHRVTQGKHSHSFGFIPPETNQPNTPTQAQLPKTPKVGGTGLHNPALGRAEAIYPLPLQPLPQADVTPVHRDTQAQPKPSLTPPADLYQQWLAAIHQGDLKPTVTESRKWLQKRLAGKGSQSWRKTPTMVDFDQIARVYFIRAILDPNSRIRLNPTYTETQRDGKTITNGKAKYLLTDETLV
jgi:hypothetical protein